MVEHGELSKTIHVGKCNKRQRDAGCIQSEAQEPKKLDRYFKEVKICVKRANFNFANFVKKMKTGGECHQGFKLCPSKSVKDSDGARILDSAMCIPESEKECPITDIVFGEKNPKEDCFDSKIQIGSKNYLYLSRKCGRGPISDLKIGESAICRKEEKFYKEETHALHPLLINHPEDCGINPNAFSITSRSQKEILSLNKVPTDQIQGYEDNIENFFYNLFKVYYTKWKPEHRTDLGLAAVYSHGKIFRTMKTYHLIAIIYLLIAGIVVAGIIPINLFFKFIDEKKRLKEMEDWQQLIIFVGKWFFKLFQFPLMIILTYYTWSLVKKFERYDDASFSDRHENKRMAAIGQDLRNSILDYDYYALIFTGIALVVDLAIGAVWFYSKSVKKEREDKLIGELELNG